MPWKEWNPKFYQVANSSHSKKAEEENERPGKLKRCQGRGTGHLWMVLILFDAPADSGHYREHQLTAPKAIASLHSFSHTLFCWSSVCHFIFSGKLSNRVIKQTALNQTVNSGPLIPLMPYALSSNLNVHTLHLTIILMAVTNSVFNQIMRVA